MAKRFVGREPFFRGKSLFELCCNLKNFGEGRVVYRHSHVKFPETSYFRLVKVQPDMSDPAHRGGQAWGEKVHRGHKAGIIRIDSGYKTDWGLVPKEQEAEFCRITSVFPEKPAPPANMPCPPLLELLVRPRSESAKQVGAKEPLMLPLRVKRDRREKERERAAKSLGI